MLMDPAYPDIVGEWANARVDDSAHDRMCNGKHQRQFDPQFLTAVGTASSAQEVAEMLITAAGEMEIAENRLW
jgi:hypothetical protein